MCSKSVLAWSELVSKMRARALWPLLADAGCHWPELACSFPRMHPCCCCLFVSMWDRLYSSSPNTPKNYFLRVISTLKHYSLFWHSFWHTIWKYIWLAYTLTFHSGILSGICSDILSHILSGILSEILSGIWLKSSSAHWDLEFAVEIRSTHWTPAARGLGPAARTELWSSRLKVRQCPLRSGTAVEVRQRAHWDLAPAVEVRSAYWDLHGWGPAVRTEIHLGLAIEVPQCSLTSGACRWGPAVPTAIRSSRVRSGWCLAVPSDIWSSLLRPGGEEGRKEGSKESRESREGGREEGCVFNLW